MPADQPIPIRIRILFLGGMVILGLLSLFFLASCSQSSPSATSTSTRAGQLTLYQSATPSLTPVPPTPLIEIPLTPAPSSTPFLHKIVKGETMLGIAIKYGVELNALLAANPTVNPRLLSVGTELVIPLNGKDAEVIPTLTPVALLLQDVRCYPSKDGGSWCVLQVENSWNFNLENLSAWIGIYNDDGNQFASQIAIAPLNRLPPGGRLPLMAFFPAPLPEGFTVRSELLTSFAIGEDDPRYINASIDIDAVKISGNGLQSEVNGRVLFPSDNSTSPRQVWVVLMALDADNRVVGMRKAEYPLSCDTSQESSTLHTPSLTPEAQPCPPLPFNLTVYSLGPLIVRVEGLVEARP